MLRVDIHKRLGDFEMRRSWEAVPGRVTALFGPSGSGKSLTFKCVAGIVRPDSGTISLDGEPMFSVVNRVDMPPERRGIGYVPQHYALFPHLDALGNVAYAISGLGRSERRAKAMEYLESVELADRAGRYPRQLSGGERQRVALVRAMATKPRALLLDEPFSAVDASLRGKLRAELVKFLGGVDIPVAMITHDREDIDALNGEMVEY